MLTMKSVPDVVKMSPRSMKPDAVQIEAEAWHLWSSVRVEQELRTVSLSSLILAKYLPESFHCDVMDAACRIVAAWLKNSRVHFGGLDRWLLTFPKWSGEFVLSRRLVPVHCELPAWMKPVSVLPSCHVHYPR